jgi:hypothetical protein
MVVLLTVGEVFLETLDNRLIYVILLSQSRF